MTVRRLFTTLFLVALFAMAVRETLDPDMWWHLRTGEYILQEGIPRQDVFSFTVPDHEWITHEWLSQVFMWGVYQFGGLPGLIIVFALLITLTFWLVYLVTPGRPFLAAFVVLLAAFAAAIVWGARPQIFNLLLTAVFVFLLERFKDKKIGRRALWLLPVISCLWANLHSGYLLGVVLLGTYTVGEALQQWRGGGDRTLPWSDIRFLAMITALSFGTAVLNPNGPELWIYPFFTLGSSAMQVYIQEWHSPDFHVSIFWPFIALAGLGVIGMIFSQRRPTWGDLLLFGGTLAAGLLSARNIPLFAIVSAPIVARHVLGSLDGTAVYPILSGEKPERRATAVMQALNWLLLLLAVLGALGWTATKIAGNEAAVAARFPVTAVDYLESSGLAEQPGYNSYNWGGYLIWRGLPVFVDGRADVYGDPFLFYYLQTFEVADNWQEPLDDYAVAYVLMETGAPLTTLLQTSPDWQLAFADDVAQIFIRR
ncbi:MAG: hypothetical protein IPH82_12305 [Chloroflexi bacterium]|nr:hypothetical protein [Chloroflexota bacterium]